MLPVIHILSLHIPVLNAAIIASNYAAKTGPKNARVSYQAPTKRILYGVNGTTSAQEQLSLGASNMFLFHILQASPVEGVAICLCLATIWWCARMVRRGLGPDRFLLGVLGLLSVCMATRILIHEGGMKAIIIPHFDGAVDAVIAVLFLVSAVILRISIAEHVDTKIQLRLAQNEGPVKLLRRGVRPPRSLSSEPKEN